MRFGSSLPPFKDWPALARLRQWWRKQAPHRQDRYAVLAPLFAVLLFMAAMLATFAYLRLEEIERDHEEVRHDVEYAQQHLRLRLIERQEQFMRLARELAHREIDTREYAARTSAILAQNPYLQRLSWLDEQRRVRASHANATMNGERPFMPGSVPGGAQMLEHYKLARELEQPLYLQRNASTDGHDLLQLYIPMFDRSRFAGMLLAEYSVEGLYRYGIPAELGARYAMALLDAEGALLAGSSTPRRNPTGRLRPWLSSTIEYSVPVTPVGNGLVIRAQAYRTAQGLIGSRLFWLVGALSAMTAWMLIANWRHTRRRVQAQKALVAETNFRRAMENSMPTGMRALDLQGRITYVNAAFCQMTGWSEAELVGCTAPFPYWPEEDREVLMARLDDELTGRTTSGGFQVRVKRKNNTIFDARIYVSPLIDARGLQTGWMTSITDITEPNRVREQLYASYERFTTVLEALDASVSVAPIGSDELLFANKLYRLWFGDQIQGHQHMTLRAGQTLPTHPGDSGSLLPDSETENAEIYVDSLSKWLEIRMRYLTWVDGRLAQMMIATDITPRRVAEEQAAAQTERAQTASRLITMGEMASSVAHELNQPLTAISNYCNGMVSRIKAKQITEEALVNALEKTAKQAQRAGQIIQRIRAFVKRSEPNWALSDTGGIISEAVELAEIGMRRYSVRLVSEVQEGLPPLLVDPILIEQVLVNLLKNGAESIMQARRPMDQRRVELRVSQTRIEDKPVVQFSVTDTGRGIAPEVMERLYEAFYTTKVEGMGIGLSLCRSIVESHKGRMKAENIYNGDEVTGCCFSFWIPLPEAGSDKGRLQYPTEHTVG